MSAYKHRMIKVKVARAPQAEYDTPDTTNSPAPAATVVADSTTPHSTVTLSTSTAALAAIVTLLGLVLLSVTGLCFYRQRKKHSQRSKAPSASIEFNRDAFTERKVKLEFDQHARENLTSKMAEAKASPGSQSTFSTSTANSDQKTSAAVGWRPQINGQLKVTNNIDEDPFRVNKAPPKLLSEKEKRPSPTKPGYGDQSLSVHINPEDMVRSPPPSYDIANGGNEFIFPIPSHRPAEKVRIAPPPTPPANRKSHSSTSPPAKRPNVQHLEIVPASIPIPIVSPARSESFAPKDLIMPTPPPTSATAAGSSSKQTLNMPPGCGSSHNPFSPVKKGDTSTRTPRMMHVIAPYIPTLEDELSIQIGDTVRVLQEYQDGWCFAQFVGKADAPKGVVPLICLEDRRRLVPVGHVHNGSNSSLSHLNVNSLWRY